VSLLYSSHHKRFFAAWRRDEVVILFKTTVLHTL